MDLTDMIVQLTEERLLLAEKLRFVEREHEELQERVSYLGRTVTEMEASEQSIKDDFERYKKAVKKEVGDNIASNISLEALRITLLEK